MTELLTSAQMRAIEAAAIATGDVTGLELMERAGRGVVAAVFEEWPDLAMAPHRAVVLCGPGNNGGDGFVVARLLKDWGWEVTVFLLGDPERMPPDATANYLRWRDMGEVRPVPGPDAPHDPWASDLIVDALFGTGLTRAISRDAALGRMLPGSDLRDDPGRPRIVAVDIPSGLCADSGRPLEDGVCLWADLTVTFHTRKPGQFLGRGPFLCGKVRVADIGLEGRSRHERITRPIVALPADPDAPVRLTGRPAPRVAQKDDPFGREGHKYAHGHALVLSGGPGRGGAARLAARGALRIGAGLVTVGCPPAALQENAARLDAIMLKPVHDADALARILEDTRITALCLGPGLGTGEREAALVAAALAVRRATVLDADALTLLAQHPDLVAALHEACVLTPHAGEFARLFPDIAGKLAAPATEGPAFSKLDAARAAAARAGCTVLCKGPDTVIADAKGEAAVNSAHYDRAAPWLATAGSGDVLAGFVAGLLARGFAPMQAAENAAWLHVECARAFGPGLIAEDLPEALPGVFRRLGH
jgi:ADP-dependent NAD(P)H-hydrate dehydratase / NAD(P)H-hydrate epimerase